MIDAQPDLCPAPCGLPRRRLVDGSPADARPRQLVRDSGQPDPKSGSEPRRQPLRR